MSKRAGTVITLEDLVDAIGVDAARYALARYSVGLADRHRHRPVDPGQPATTRSTTCSTSHARTASVARNAAEVGLTRGEPGDFRPELLDHEKENDLLKALGEFPRGGGHARPSCASRTGSRATWRTLAGAYHRFYDNCRVLPLGDEAITDLHRARLWLNDATRTVIANGLGLLGVSAPERM